MSILNKSKLSEAKAFQSDLKPFLNKPFVTNWLSLMLCIEGCAVLSIDFKEQPLRKGDFAIVPDGISLIPRRTSRLFKVEIISVAACHCEEMEYKIRDIAFWNSLMEYPVLHPSAVQYEMLCGWFAQMKWIMADPLSPFLDETLSSSILTLFLQIYKKTIGLIQEPDKEQVSNRTKKLFTDFTNLVTRYHNRNREVAFYANLLSITPDYLNKVCRMHWNTSAKENIDWQVVMAIKNYLTCTDLSIKNIAAQFNFNAPSYMCRFFKKHAGMSPLEYREGITK